MVVFFVAILSHKKNFLWKLEGSCMIETHTHIYVSLFISISDVHFTQITTMAQVGPLQSQELLRGPPHGFRGTKHLCLPLLLFQACQQRASAIQDASPPHRRQVYLLTHRVGIPCSLYVYETHIQKGRKIFIYSTICMDF